MQQYKIIPAIAASWALLFAANTLLGTYDEYRKEIAKSGTPSKHAFEILAEIHGVAAGLKAVSTWQGEHHSELIKQACGGHGYLQASGLTILHLNMGVGLVTAEGDNTVMC